MSNSDLNRLVLKNITLKTGGTYKCEVSADRPTFKTSGKESDMIVIGKSTICIFVYFSQSRTRAQEFM